MDLLKTPRSVWRGACRLWDWLKGPQARGLFAVVAVLALILATYNSQIAKNDSGAAKKSSAAAASSSAAAEVTARHALISQNNHHSETVKSNALLQSEAVAIDAEGKIIIDQNTEILQDHAQTQSTLDALTALQGEFNTAQKQDGAAVLGGQAQINTYFGYLTCIVLHGDSPACGAAPPLPQT